MTPNDIIYNEVYKGYLKAGCNEFVAKNAAVDALQKFKNGQFTGKASKLIPESITNAKKLIVKKRK